jgi:hypothetical protein
MSVCLKAVEVGSAEVEAGDQKGAVTHPVSSRNRSVPIFRLFPSHRQCSSATVGQVLAGLLSG